MGLFCFNCRWLFGHGPGVPSIIHESTCSNYDAEEHARYYPKLNVDRAHDIARMYQTTEYALIPCRTEKTIRDFSQRRF